MWAVSPAFWRQERGKLHPRTKNLLPAAIHRALGVPIDREEVGTIAQRSFEAAKPSEPG